MVTYAAADIQSGISDYKVLVSWCDPLTWSPRPSEENPIFLTEDTKMRFLVHVCLGCWEENGVQRLKVFPNVPCNKWGFVISAGGDCSNPSCHHRSAFLFQNWIIYSFFSLLFALLSRTVDLNFAFYAIQPWSRPKHTGLLFYRDLSAQRGSSLLRRLRLKQKAHALVVWLDAAMCAHLCVYAFEVVLCECKQPAFSLCVSHCIFSLAPEGFG